MIRFGTVLLVLALLGQARGDFTYNDFSSTSGLKLNGDAAVVGSQLRLSYSNINSTSGTAFTSNAVALGNFGSFSTRFQFQITSPGGIGDSDGVGGDGFVFVVQGMGSNALGINGTGMGYQGVSPSLGIEFDTFQNSIDPSGNHVGVDINGSYVSIATANEPTRFNNGQVWNAWIDYDGVASRVDVRWSLTNIRPTAPELSATVNLQQILGTNSGYVGFTAGSAFAYENHNILNWQFQQNAGTVPEPSSILMLGVGVIGFAGCRRLRRG